MAAVLETRREEQQRTAPAPKFETLARYAAALGKRIAFTLDDA